MKISLLLPLKFKLAVLILLASQIMIAQASLSVGQAAPNLSLDNTVQGRLYVVDYRPTRGSPLLEPTWLPGKIHFLENEYSDLLLSYDLRADVVILWYGANQKIQLNSHYLTYFILDGRYFTNLAYGPYAQIELVEGFYEVYYQDQISLLVKRALEVNVRESVSYFSRADRWYLIKEGQAHEMGNKKDLLTVFDKSHHKAIKRFLRKRYIRMRKADDNDWLFLMPYLNTLVEH